jgi:hypothetical protein
VAAGVALHDPDVALSVDANSGVPEIVGAVERVGVLATGFVAAEA